MTGVAPINQPAPNGRIVVMTPSRPDDSGEVLRVMTEAYAAAFAAAGYSPVMLATDDPAFEALTRRHAADPRVVAFYSLAGHGLYHWVDAPDRARDLFERAGKPFICHHGDHPFQPKMRPRMHVDFAGKHAFFNDPASLAWLAETGPHRAKFHYSPPSLVRPADEATGGPRPAAERDIQLLFVGNLAKVGFARDQLALAHPHLLGVADEITARALFDYTTPIMEVGRQVMAGRGLAFDPRSEAVQDLLGFSDWIVRHKRRQRMLSRVRRHPVTVISQEPVAWPDMHPASRCVSRVRLPHVVRLCGRARAMLVPQPTYPGGLTERILYAMHQGTVVIATPSPALEHYFVPGRDLLVVAPDLSDVEEMIDLTLDDDLVDEIGRNARAAVERFAPERIVEGYLAAVRAAGGRI